MKARVDEPLLARRRGWVVEIGGRADGWAHPLGKSAANSKAQAYIANLLRRGFCELRVDVILRSSKEKF